jgi:hypothetical protein
MNRIQVRGINIAARGQRGTVGINDWSERTASLQLRALFVNLQTNECERRGLWRRAYGPHSEPIWRPTSAKPTPANSELKPAANLLARQTYRRTYSLVRKYGCMSRGLGCRFPYGNQLAFLGADFLVTLLVRADFLRGEVARGPDFRKEMAFPYGNRVPSFSPGFSLWCLSCAAPTAAALSN